MNWPSNLVNSASSKCSLVWHKVRKSITFTEINNFYIQTYVHLNSIFPFCLFKFVAILFLDQLLGYCWGNRLNHSVLITVFLIDILTFKIRRASWGGWVFIRVPKGFRDNNFPVLKEAFHWPILSFNPHFCQLLRVIKF